VFDSTESNNVDTKNKSFNSRGLTPWGDYSIGGNEASQISNFLKKVFNYQMSNEEKSSILRIAVSPTGANAYKDCLKANADSVFIDVPEIALSEPKFSIKVSWRPKYTPTSTQTNGKITILNGFFPGNKTEFVTPIKVNGEVSVDITRSMDMSTTITFTADNKSDQVVLAKQLPVATWNIRYKDVRFDLTSYDFSGGAGFKSTHVCLTRTDNVQSILLFKKAFFKNVNQVGPGNSSRYAVSATADEGDDMKVCADASVSDAGTKNRFHIDGIFSVPEVYLVQTQQPANPQAPAMTTPEAPPNKPKSKR
jgi:hypothetical protein